MPPLFAHFPRASVRNEGEPRQGYRERKKEEEEEEARNATDVRTAAR